VEAVAPYKGVERRPWRAGEAEERPRREVARPGRTRVRLGGATRSDSSPTRWLEDGDDGRHPLVGDHERREAKVGCGGPKDQLGRKGMER
jgi:hypothetical protein